MAVSETADVSGPSTKERDFFMRLLARISVLLLLMGAATGLLALQRGGASQSQEDQYGTAREAFTGGGEDPNAKSEYSWSRLRYTPSDGNFRGYGFSYGRWSTDYPKADRQFLIALKRLTRIQARPTEQVVDLDELDATGTPVIFNFPWVYAVQVQSWTFSETEAKRLREYLLKGGFIMVDDFHGADDWEHFMRGMLMVFPDRPIEDLTAKDEIFHVLYDLSDRFQVPGEQYVSTGRMARDPGRRWPRYGGHLPQHAPRRRLGMGRRSALSGKVCVARVPHRHQLRNVRNDALTANFSSSLQ